MGSSRSKNGEEQKRKHGEGEATMKIGGKEKSEGSFPTFSFFPFPPCYDFSKTLSQPFLDNLQSKIQNYRVKYKFQKTNLITCLKKKNSKNELGEIFFF